MSDGQVLLAVPRPPRDLDGHALLAFHLQRRHGIKTRLFTGPELERDLLSHPPDVLVLDFLGWPDRAIQARLAHRLGIAVALLPTAGVYPDPVWFLRAAGKFTGVSRSVAAFLLWGNYSRDTLLEDKLAAPARIWVTGCPRFDFYAPPYLSLMTQRTALLDRLGITNHQAPLILWSTNTNEWNNRHGRGGKAWRQRAGDAASIPNQELVAILQDQKTQFHAHSTVVSELAALHPEWNVLIRVHPLEAVTPYERIAAKRNNLFVDSTAPIRDLLYHCNVLLQRGCTVATEAWMLDKPVLQLSMGSFQMEWATPEHLAGSHPVATIAEADEVIRGYLSGMPIPQAQLEARQRYLERYYYRVDGRSAERCADALAAIVETAKRTGPDRAVIAERARAALQDLRRKEAQRLPNRVKDVLHIEREKSLRIWRQGPAQINPSQVAELFARFAQALQAAQPDNPGQKSRTESNGG